MDTEPVRPSLDHYKDFPAVRDWPRFEGREAAAFIRANSAWELYRSDGNAALLLGWCSALAVPVTRWNLAIAFHELVARDTLRPTRGDSPPESSGNRGIKLCRGDALAEYVPSKAETEQLSRLRDDIYVTDAERKSKDAALRALATRQRLALRNQRGTTGKG